MRLSNGVSKGIVAAVAVGALTLAGPLALSGCASDGDSGAKQSEPAAKETAKEPAPPKGVAPPAGHALAKVQNNMSPEQVQQIMGAPSGQANYPSAKMFNPFNYGNDSGQRVEYKYQGQGRVVFAVPKYGGNMKVVRVDYDPNEDGN